MAQTHRQTDRQTHRHANSMTNLAQWGKVGESLCVRKSINSLRNFKSYRFYLSFFFQTLSNVIYLSEYDRKQLPQKYILEKDII